MKKIIGFATQYYTLWDYEEVPQYKTDSYGNHHQVGIQHNYYYIKNISFDLDKVKKLYPSLSIDDSLKGKTNSFNYITQNLPKGYFWAGKYTGKLIDEIIESDFQYCVWSANNYSGKVSKYIKNHPKYIAHFENLEKTKQAEINSKTLLKVGDVVTLEFLCNGYNADDEYTECWTEAIYGDINVYINCGVKRVGGMYPYLMPVINGKAQKTKGKSISVTVIDIFWTDIRDGRVYQNIKVV